jgi:hypothetical protein
MSDHDTNPRHESVDHEEPTAAGTLEGEEHVPGTGIMGDETLVRDVPGGLHLNDGQARAKRSDGRPHPGPTPEAAMDEAEMDNR